MNVFIAGATGVLGSRLTRQLVDRGHRVVGLSRRPENDARIRALGGEPRNANLFDTDSLARAAEGCEVVIHAATAIPASTRFNPADWTMNDRIRREGTQALAEAARHINAAAYVQQSIVWVARPPDQSRFDEESPLRPGPLYASAADCEDIARTTAAKGGAAVAILRGGWFYDPDSQHIRAFADMLRQRKMPIIAGGRNRWSLVHTDDMASAFVAAAENPRNGLWHVVDDQPATMHDFLSHFAELLGAPRPVRMPRWLARIAAGKFVVEYLTANTETSNGRLKQDLGWTPKYPTYREGLRQVVEQLRRPPAAAPTARAASRTA